MLGQGQQGGLTQHQVPGRWHCAWSIRTLHTYLGDDGKAPFTDEEVGPEVWWLVKVTQPGIDRAGLETAWSTGPAWVLTHPDLTQSYLPSN